MAISCCMKKDSAFVFQCQRRPAALSVDEQIFTIPKIGKFAAVLVPVDPLPPFWEQKQQTAVRTAIRRTVEGPTGKRAG